MAMEEDLNTGSSPSLRNLFIFVFEISRSDFTAQGGTRSTGMQHHHTDQKCQWIINQDFADDNYTFSQLHYQPPHYF